MFKFFLSQILVSQYSSECLYQLNDKPSFWATRFTAL